ncbi:UBA/TS-N domain containing protein [Trichomonas vaginalis G3]|uniref:UBA/TS-N domain containing protein n=1 Tax=Trichomonas vaginalis (strain ATCC PRA-98 / G3) TaxID=412133 RepID=A2EZV3_TRIV3|nr:ubiquitin-like family [Trichomonas vaginalis G3]EAY01816.1 UBA/TS-N domain containing protein [Trichomonas vaginalis G3]KAI5550383.1 ubiquitin-like family [Trichomonas vaginalis G3]|eukprot:XP_001314363.1 UBA/TS-N domain containing protein [Trichomonas vaginalis G3]
MSEDNHKNIIITIKFPEYDISDLKFTLQKKETCFNLKNLISKKTHFPLEDIVLEYNRQEIDDAALITKDFQEHSIKCYIHENSEAKENKLNQSNLDIPKSKIDFITRLGYNSNFVYKALQETNGDIDKTLLLLTSTAINQSRISQSHSESSDEPVLLTKSSESSSDSESSNYTASNEPQPVQKKKIIPVKASDYSSDSESSDESTNRTYGSTRKYKRQKSTPQLSTKELATEVVIIDTSKRNYLDLFEQCKTLNEKQIYLKLLVLVRKCPHVSHETYYKMLENTDEKSNFIAIDKKKQRLSIAAKKIKPGLSPDVFESQFPRVRFDPSEAIFMPHSSQERYDPRRKPKQKPSKPVATIKTPPKNVESTEENQSETSNDEHVTLDIIDPSNNEDNTRKDNKTSSKENLVASLQNFPFKFNEIESEKSDQEDNDASDPVIIDKITQVAEYSTDDPKSNEESHLPNTQNWSIESNVIADQSPEPVEIDKNQSLIARVREIVISEDIAKELLDKSNNNPELAAVEFFKKLLH